VLPSVLLLFTTSQHNTPKSAASSPPKSRPQNRSQKQVDTELGDALPDVEALGRLKFTMRVIAEAMRLYPQPPVLIRRALEVCGGGVLGALRGGVEGMVGRAPTQERNAFPPTPPTPTPPQPNRNQPTNHKPKDDAFDEYTVPKGADIFISVWNLHRDPANWDRPHEFDPDRCGVQQGGGLGGLIRS
jgi:beta-ring hydroxylase